MSSIILLLDLDDTLLDTNMEAFIPAYFSALSTFLADLVAPQVMLPALMGGTKAMQANTDPALTLRQVFDAHFFPKVGIERLSLQSRIDRFYEEVFPSIQHVTRPRPDAQAFVDWALAAGHRLAIATNPLFPLAAVHHRLRWAGLPPEQYPFALVACYETFHFVKETRAYFPEFLGHLGWPDAPVVMIGNDLELDLLPARAAGLPVFWVRNGKDESHADIPQGSFDDLRNWLEAADPETLQPRLDTPDPILAALRATPASLAALAHDAPPEAWLRSPAVGEWCLTEILCHLRDVEIELHRPRFEKVLKEEDPFLPGVESDRWAQERQYARQDGRQALDDFIAARKSLLSLLDGLQAEWSRPARHAIFGPTTLCELAGFAAGHDRAHIRQAWAALHG